MRPTVWYRYGPARKSSTSTATMRPGTRNSRTISCADGGSTGGKPGSAGGVGADMDHLSVGGQLSLLGPQPPVDHRRGEQDRIDDVEDAPESRYRVAGVLL